jgi:hypothetical protein
VISFYCIKYFDYFRQPALFGVLNAAVILCGGLTSSLLAGYICDKYEPSNLKIKSRVCSLLSLMGAPLFCMIFLIHSNFYFGIGMLFLENLCAEGWMAPSIAMIQTVIDVKYKAVSVGVFFFATSITSACAAVVLGQLITAFNLNQDTITELGYVLAFNTAVPCIIASFCFWKCGAPYEEFLLL